MPRSLWHAHLGRDRDAFTSRTDEPQAIEDEEPYDAVCLDIMMPEMDGHHALPAIRETEEKRGIMGSDGAKVIMVTALQDSLHCIQSFREGCESYVTKPVSQSAIIDKMRELGVITENAPARSSS
ncbi:MAG: response regulator [Planctomycetota bacterium]|nr:response regulator [Planctomycetota bacterium]